jgi:hypothetical protein
MEREEQLSRPDIAMILPMSEFLSCFKGTVSLVRSGRTKYPAPLCFSPYGYYCLHREQSLKMSLRYYSLAWLNSVYR